MPVDKGIGIVVIVVIAFTVETPQRNLVSAIATANIVVHGELRVLGSAVGAAAYLQQCNTRTNSKETTEHCD